MAASLGVFMVTLGRCADFGPKRKAKSFDFYGHRERQVPSIYPIEGASLVFVDAYYCGFCLASHILAPS